MAKNQLDFPPAEKREQRFVAGSMRGSLAVRSVLGRLGVTVCTISIFAFGGCGRPKPAAPTVAVTPPPAREVRVSDVRLRSWPKSIRVQGKLFGFEQSTISSKMAGRVDKVQIDRGSNVQQGQALAVLDTKELILKVEQAEAQLSQACAAIGMKPEDSELQLQRENAPPVVVERALLKYAEASMERAETLMERGGVTKDEYENLVAQRNVADAKYKSALNSVGAMIANVRVRRAELALAREQLEEATIVAPFDAVVEQRHISPGESIQVGAPIVTLVRVDTLRFTAGVPERAASPIHQGQSIHIHLEGYSQTIEATISRVSPSVDPESRVVWIEADVPNPGLKLRAGLFAEAEIVIDPDERSLTVPLNAVREFAGLEKVAIVRDGVASEQTIRTGRRNGNWVEVLSGLNAGDVIVSGGAEGISGPVLPIRDTDQKALADTARSPDEGGASQ